MINRNRYLKKLESSMWNDSIKVITGMRRCGKSFLLNRIFYEFLISKGVNDNNIIKFAFDSADDLRLIDEDLIELEIQNRKVSYKKFMDYVSQRISDGEKYYFLLDEIQRLEAFETVLNGYLRKGNIDEIIAAHSCDFSRE